MLALEWRLGLRNPLAADLGKTGLGGISVHEAGQNVPCRLPRCPAGENLGSGHRVGGSRPWAVQAELWVAAGLQPEC
jgi:hypothetical protein